MGWTTDTDPASALRQHLLYRIALTNGDTHSNTRGAGTDGDTTAAYAVAMDGDAVVVAGTRDNPGTGKIDAFVQRFDGDNQPDTRFGTDGITAIEAPTALSIDMLIPRDIVVDTSDGYLYIGATGEDTNDNRQLDASEEVAVGRVLANGDPDTVFASGDSEGYLRFSYRTESTATGHIAEALTGEQSGRFLVAGSYDSDEDGNQDQASALAFTADTLTSDNGDSEDEAEADTNGDGGGGGSGGGGAPGMILFGLLLVGSAWRRGRRIGSVFNPISLIPRPSEQP